MTRTITLVPNQHAIFGYGSLLSKASMERTLGRQYNEEPAICTVAGWRRSWDVFLPNEGKFVDEQGRSPHKIIYLNVRLASGTPVNGVLYVVGTAALAGFDSREWVYDRVDITNVLGGVEVRGGSVWMYVGKPEFVVAAPQRPEYAVRRTYLDVVEKGLSDLGREFRAGYEASTDAVPESLVIQDRLAR
jgi:cation transport regulator ChaC